MAAMLGRRPSWSMRLTKRLNIGDGLSPVELDGPAGFGTKAESPTVASILSNREGVVPQIPSTKQGFSPLFPLVLSSPKENRGFPFENLKEPLVSEIAVNCVSSNEIVSEEEGTDSGEEESGDELFEEKASVDVDDEENSEDEEDASGKDEDEFAVVAQANTEEEINVKQGKVFCVDSLQSSGKISPVVVDPKGSAALREKQT
ncbi:hypothetical protein U1Q18_009908 [Sarracenia purpurea var. burkii]